MGEKVGIIATVINMLFLIQWHGTERIQFN